MAVSREGSREGKKEAYAVASKQLRVIFTDGLFTKLKQVKKPAVYLQSFVEGELFRRWLEQPRSIDNGSSLTFRILSPSKDAVIFSPKAQLTVEIEYMPGDLVVQAKGLYFRYRANGIPEPVLDDLKMETDYKSLVISKVRALGDELGDDLDLPIKVILKDKPQFGLGDNGRRGGIPFDVEVGFPQLNSVNVTARNLVLYPGNKVDWKGSELLLDMPMKPPIPIGSTPFAFWTMSGSFGPRDKTLGFGTRISTLATEPSIVNLNVRAKTQLPMKDIAIIGALEIANVPLLSTDGKIDFSKGTIDGSFTANDTPLKQIAFAKGSFHLQREVFVTDGEMKVFGQKCGDMHGEINLTDGSAILTANRGFKVFGVDVSESLEGHVDAGFHRAQIICQASVEVHGIKPYDTLPVSATVTMDSSDGIVVEAYTFVKGLDVRFTVDSLEDCTLERLQEEIGDGGTKAYHQFLTNLAAPERNCREFARKLDKRTRDYVEKKMHITWETGNPELDALGKKLSIEFHNAGGALTDFNSGVGRTLTEGREA